MSNKMSENLKKWACSFSGCDGGNSKADIWLCGIEWGYSGATKGEKEEYYTKGLPEEIKQGEVKLTDNFDWKGSITYTYGRSFAKIYTAINGGEVADYKDVVKLKGDELFKLNLYPIAFSHTGDKLWNTYNLNETTGFKSKYLFNTWCFFNRFSWFAKIRQEKKPKLIICTGVSYLRDFLMCFGGNENIDKVKTGILKPISDNNQHDRTFYHVKIDDTLLVVIPFFSGSYGLNSNYLLQEMGNKIKELMPN